MIQSTKLKSKQRLLSLSPNSKNKVLGAQKSKESLGVPRSRKNFVILGIECTAHTFGVGIVDKGNILANVRDMYVTESGGIIPTESAEHHKRVAEGVYDLALKEAGVSEGEIDAIAISNAPGLAPCLYAGLNFAKEKAKKLGVSLIPVNHCVAHLEIGQSVGAKVKLK